jgi:hypothetical protein
MKKIWKEARDDLVEESTQRYVMFLKITLSLSFGGVLFLLGFEKDFVLPESEAKFLIYAAWWFLCLSAFSGLLSLWEWATHPIRRVKDTDTQLKALPANESETTTGIHVSGKTSKISEISFRLHLLGFVFGTVCLISFKALN